ncbi:hypothetical protein E4V01_01440 [Methylorubrum sp. Q1]|nr:hypothetical protein E4V01_01440 [Methylorubrum sp. Q1]
MIRQGAQGRSSTIRMRRTSLGVVTSCEAFASAARAPSAGIRLSSPSSERTSCGRGAVFLKSILCGVMPASVMIFPNFWRFTPTS